MLLIVTSATDLVKGIIDVVNNGPAILVVSPAILMVSFVSNTFVVEAVLNFVEVIIPSRFWRCWGLKRRTFPKRSPRSKP